MDKVTYGKLGEDEAQNYLIKHGYKIVERNYKLKYGEVDIIALKNKVIIFVEVKTRLSDLFGAPAEAVDIKKQQKIIKVAKQYLLRKNIYDCPCRFDIVEVYLKDGRCKINHIEDAFWAQKWGLL